MNVVSFWSSVISDVFLLQWLPIFFSSDRHPLFLGIGGTSQTTRLSLSLSLLGFQSRMYNSLSILHINPVIFLDEPLTQTPRTLRAMVNIGGHMDTMQAHLGENL